MAFQNLSHLYHSGSITITLTQKYHFSTLFVFFFLLLQIISLLHPYIYIYITPHVLLFYRMLWSMEEIKIIHIPLVTPCCDSYGLYASRNNPTLVDKLIQKFILVAIKYSMHGTHESRRYDQSITKVLSIRFGDKSTVQSFGLTILNVDVTIAYYSFFFFLIEFSYQSFRYTAECNTKLWYWYYTR